MTSLRRKLMVMLAILRNLFSITGLDWLSFRAKNPRMKSLVQDGKCVQTNLPLGYTQLEYVGSSGTQYIDTGVFGPDVTAFELKGTIATSGGQNTQFIGGTSQAATSFFGARAIGSEITWYCVTAQGSNIGNPSHVCVVTSTIESASSQPGTLYDTKTGTTTEYAKFASTSWGFGEENILLFCGSETRRSPNATCYYLKLYTANGLAFYGIPAKNSSNAVGLYDLVSGTFFANSGTGDFVAGNAVVPTPDTPVDIVCNNGVLKLSPNLYKLEIMKPDTRNGVTISVDADGLLHLDGAPTTTTAVLLTAYNGSFTNGFTFSAHLLSGTYSGNKSSFYPDLSHSYSPSIGINTYRTSTSTDKLGTIYLTLRVGDTFNNVVIGIQILSGIASSMPTYHPYGQVYADGTAETINVHGKNLFDKDNTDTSNGYVANAYLNSSGSKVNDGSYNISVYIPVNEKTSYYYAINGSKTQLTQHHAPRVAFYDSNKEYISSSSALDRGATFKTPVNCSYLRLPIYKTSLEYGVQLELGSTATPYEPYYNGGTATAADLLSVGDYKDVQDVIGGSVVRNVGVKVLDGTEDWVKGSTTFYADEVITDFKVGSSNFQYSLCTHYTMAGDSEALQLVNTNSTRLSIRSNGKHRISIFAVLNDYADANAFAVFLATQYAAGTPVIVVYPLATPTTEQLTPTYIPLQDGTTTIDVAAEVNDVEISAKVEASTFVDLTNQN